MVPPPTAPLDIYDRLAPLETALTGPWRWATYAAIAEPLEFCHSNRFAVWPDIAFVASGQVEIPVGWMTFRADELGARAIQIDEPSASAIVRNEGTGPAKKVDAPCAPNCCPRDPPPDR